MNPSLLAALLSFSPALLSKLFGDPQQKLRAQLMKLSSPANLAGLTNQNYQQVLGSPAYQGGLGTIAAGANATAGNVARQLGASGIGSTGTGAILSSLTPSLVGSQRAGLQTSAYNTAQSQAQNQIKQQIEALTGTSGPSQSQQLFAGGLEAFLPYLQGLLHGHLAGSRSYRPQAGFYGPGGQIAGGSYVHS